MSVGKRKEILRSFYKKVIGTYFSSPVEGSETGWYISAVCKTVFPIRPPPHLSLLFIKPWFIWSSLLFIKNHDPSGHLSLLFIKPWPLRASQSVVYKTSSCFCEQSFASVVLSRSFCEHCLFDLNLFSTAVERASCKVCIIRCFALAGSPPTQHLLFCW